MEHGSKALNQEVKEEAKEFNQQKFGDFLRHVNKLTMILKNEGPNVISKRCLESDVITGRWWTDCTLNPEVISLFFQTLCA